MGLTIHYSLKTRGNRAEASRIIHALHDAAQDLPFKELGDVVILSGVEIQRRLDDRNDPLRWLLIQAEESVELEKRDGWSRSVRVASIEVVAFSAWPGEGCEESNFGLCRFPRSIEADGKRVPITLVGWQWSSFCKTQYASNPDCGGVANFLRCHLTVIAMLDKARALGCLDKVSDEGHFWDNRDLKTLMAEIGSWNEMIAAFGGVLKEMAGVEVQSAITEFPNFEQLEAAGQDKIPAGMVELSRLIQATSNVARELRAAGH